MRLQIVNSTLQQGYKKCRKRRRVSAAAEHYVGPREIERTAEMRTADLFPLQEEVLLQQLTVFSAQLKVIEEQSQPEHGLYLITVLVTGGSVKGLLLMITTKATVSRYSLNCSQTL